MNDRFNVGLKDELSVGLLDGPLEEVPPCDLFGGLTDETWRWLYLEGRDHCPFLEQYLPGLPNDPEFETSMVGSSGKEMLTEGFQIYALFKEAYERNASLTTTIRALDFGCGFGRVIRFFLRDLAPENLIGIDDYDKAIALCLETNRWSQFQQCETLPPTVLEDESFDFIYAFSVFSHLSETAHGQWLEEFHRLLAPEGVIVLTTFRRKELAESHPVLGDRFVPAEAWLEAYDSGEYCFRMRAETRPHFGFTFIPESYVLEHWTERFVVNEFFEAPVHGQNVIVCTKR